MDYKSQFVYSLDNVGIKYTVLDDISVRISYSGDNADSIDVIVSFDQGGDGIVNLGCWSFGRVQADKRAAMLEACNALNTKFRWVKFYIDGDSDLAVSSDAVVDIETVGEECIQLVRRMVNIYDDAYPVLMKAMWA